MVSHVERAVDHQYRINIDDYTSQINHSGAEQVVKRTMIRDTSSQWVVTHKMTYIAPRLPLLYGVHAIVC